MDSSTTANPPASETEEAKDDAEDEEEATFQPFVEHEVRKETLQVWIWSLIIVPFNKFRDVDSSYSEDIGSVINYQSVTESIYNYRVENGRTYHAVCLHIPTHCQINS